MMVAAASLALPQPILAGMGSRFVARPVFLTTHLLYPSAAASGSAGSRGRSLVHVFAPVLSPRGVA